MAASLRVADGLEEGVVVTVFCDSAAKYLSEDFWRQTSSEADVWP